MIATVHQKKKKNIPMRLNLTNSTAQYCLVDYNRYRVLIGSMVLQSSYSGNGKGIRFCSMPHETCNSRSVRHQQRDMVPRPDRGTVVLVRYRVLGTKCWHISCLERKETRKLELEIVLKTVRICCRSVLSSHLFWTSDLWTHQPRLHRRKVTQDFSSTFFLRCVP